MLINQPIPDLILMLCGYLIDLIAVPFFQYLCSLLFGSKTVISQYEVFYVYETS